MGELATSSNHCNLIAEALGSMASFPNTGIETGEGVIRCLIQENRNVEADTPSHPSVTGVPKLFLSISANDDGEQTEIVCLSCALFRYLVT